jgi:hypothetical protein
MYPILDDPEGVWRPAADSMPGTAEGWSFNSAGSVSHPAIGSTTVQRQAPRTEFASEDFPNDVAGLVSTTPMCWRGNDARLGGFSLTARFTLTANPDNIRAFFGLSASSGYLCSDEPSNARNSLGVGFDGTDPRSGSWSIITSDGFTVQKIILDGSQAGGVAAHRNTTGVYDLVILAKPNAPSIYVRFLNLSMGETIYNGFLSSPTPLAATTAPLYVHAEAGVGAIASGAAMFDLYRLDIDSVDGGVYAPPATQPLHHLVSSAPIGLGVAVLVTNGQVEAATPRPTPGPNFRSLHAVPSLGVALETALAAGQTIAVQVAGVLDPAVKTLGAGVACAVGIDADGNLVRATDSQCVSAPNWIGHCDRQGNITIAPRRDAHLNVLDFGATGDGATDDTQAIQTALDASMRIVPVSPDPVLALSSGKIVHLPPGDYRITAPLVISNGMELRGAGFGAAETVRIKADVEHGNFNLTTRTGIPDIDHETVYCALALVGHGLGQHMNPVRGDADQCVVSGIQLYSDPNQNWLQTTLYQKEQMDGIRVLAPNCIIEKCGITAFRRNGITAYAPGDQDVNLDVTQFRDLWVFQNGKHGIDIHGNDSNSMLGLHVHAQVNGDCGIHDESEGGCTWVGCEAQSNLRYQYWCNAFSAFLGCHAEEDAPSSFSEKVVVEGGNISKITADSHFTGAVLAARGARKWEAHNPSNNIREWPGKGSGYGIKIDPTEWQFMTPGNGYFYKVITGGHTYGPSRTPPDPDPQPFPTAPGAAIPDGTVQWLFVGPTGNPEPVFASVGGDDVGAVFSFGHQRRKLDNEPADGAYWNVKDGMVPDKRKGDPFRRDRFTYVWKSYHWGISFCDYLSRPYPSAFCQPAVHYGSLSHHGGIPSPHHAERSIQAVYGGSGPSPSFTKTDDGIVKGALLPGDLFVNARVDTGTESQTPADEPWAWRVKKQGGFAYSRSQAPQAGGTIDFPWTAHTHFFMGDTVRVRVSGTDYIFECVDYDDYDRPNMNLTGDDPGPAWNPITNALTPPDGNITWQCLGPADLAPVFEPLPNRAAAQAPSTALDVDGLRVDFNTLLDKLRKANIIAT